MFSNDTAFKGVFAVFIASVLWGTTGTAASFIPEVSPVAIGAFAMTLGGLLLVITAHINLLKDKQRLRSQLSVIFLGGLSVAVYPLAFYSSMRFSGVAIGTLISIASAPFFTVLLERFISKKPIRIQWIVSFMFGVVGVALLALGKVDDLALSQSQSLKYWGIILGLIAGLTYGMYSWSARQMIETGISSNSAMASMFGIAALLLLPVLILTGSNLFSDVSHTMVAFYMAIIPMFLGYLCFGYGLKSIAASKATLITLLEPVVATFFAIMIVDERFNIAGWYGMAFITVCLLLQLVKFPAFKLQNTKI
ncbi:MAG: EamA family transporter [Oleibacter sp.]|nr:EamA family transporter [Thalassolituus sp.]